MVSKKPALLEKPWLLFLSLSIVVYFTLYLPGPILKLDMITIQHPEKKLAKAFGFDETSQNGRDTATMDINSVPRLPYYLAHYLLGFLLPPWLVQKIVLTLIILLSGAGMQSLHPNKKSLGAVFSGLLYAINPFTYSRLLAGHHLILLAYAIIPFYLNTLKDFRNPSPRGLVKTSMLLAAIGALSLHMLIIVLVLSAILVLVELMEKEKMFPEKNILAVAVLWVLLSVYWLGPVISAPKNLLSRVNTEDLYSFASVGSAVKDPLISPSPHNIIFDIATMYGFWYQDMLLPKNTLPFWWLIYVFILWLSIRGAVYTWKKTKSKALFFSGTLAVIIATGISHPFSKEIYLLLFENVFFFKGFREPQKFVALLTLSYSYLGGLGIYQFEKTMKKQGGKKLFSLIIIFALLSPLVYTYPMLFGFWGQLKTTPYPTDWYEINQFLKHEAKNSNTLIMPWHMYMRFEFTNNKIMNPASNFFSTPIIQGDNIEIGGIYSQSTNPTSKYVENLLVNHSEDKNWGQLLKPINVKYVILAKEVDYQKYLFLLNQTDLELINETENLYLLENTHEVNLFYQTDDFETMEPLGFEKTSPVEYTIQAPGKKYVVFTRNYDETWKLGTQTPQKAEPVGNLWEYQGETRLQYTRFKTYLLGYAISWATLWILLLYYSSKAFRKKTDKVLEEIKKKSRARETTKSP